MLTGRMPAHEDPAGLAGSFVVLDRTFRPRPSGISG